MVSFLLLIALLTAGALIADRLIFGGLDND
jgi:hypothetical protein